MFDYYPDRSSPILVNFGSRGVTVAALLPGCSRNWPPWYEHSKLGAAALLKAVWWDLVLASLLTHLFQFFELAMSYMVALWNRADHYICMLWFVLSSSFFFSFLA